MSGRLYLEHRATPMLVESADVDTDGRAVAARLRDGSREVLRPETTSAVLVSTGCTVTAKAVRSILDGGCSLYWLSKSGLKVSGVTAAEHTGNVQLLHRQLLAVGSEKARRNTTRAALLARFGAAPPETYTMAQLRGWEGAKMRRLYPEVAAEYGIDWQKRVTSGDADFLNAVISGFNAVIYLACEVAARTLLLAPDLGFTHVCRRAFVYDVADMFKERESIRRALSWFALRDRSAPIESSFAVAKAHREEIIANVYSQFHQVVDDLLPELSNEFAECRPKAEFA